MGCLLFKGTLNQKTETSVLLAYQGAVHAEDGVQDLAHDRDLGVDAVRVKLNSLHIRSLGAQ